MNKPKTKLNKMQNVIKAGLWLIHATASALAGYILVTNYNNYFVIATGLYLLATAGLVVVVHFLKASK